MNWQNRATKTGIRIKILKKETYGTTQKKMAYPGTGYIRHRRSSGKKPKRKEKAGDFSSINPYKMEAMLDKKTD
jgi:hypothetical protein